MNVKELRIGNYLQIKNKGICIVKGINTDNFLQCKWNESDTIVWGEPIDYFQPIPITPEILERCGFKYRTENVIGTLYKPVFYTGFNYTRYSVYKVGDVFNHWYLNHEFDGRKRITSNIRYLHQLQNIIFDLTGIEIELK